MGARKVLNSKSDLQGSLKGIGNGAIQQATYDFLLDFHYSHVYLALFPRYCHVFQKT